MLIIIFNFLIAARGPQKPEVYFIRYKGAGQGAGSGGAGGLSLGGLSGGSSLGLSGLGGLGGGISTLGGGFSSGATLSTAYGAP